MQVRILPPESWAYLKMSYEKIYKTILSYNLLGIVYKSGTYKKYTVKADY